MTTKSMYSILYLFVTQRTSDKHYDLLLCFKWIVLNYTLDTLPIDLTFNDPVSIQFLRGHTH